jgi:hypothetical protein
VTEPTPLDAAHIFEFIRGSELAVIFVSVHRLHTFNRALLQQLESEFTGIGIGTIDLGGLLVSGPSVMRFLHQGLRALDAPSAVGVLPGYYLCRNGVIVAWNGGLPAFDDAAALARSALLGAAWAGISHEIRFIREALLTAADQVAAERIMLVFRLAAAGERARAHASADVDPPVVDELFWAYQTLGVLPTATDREVQEAWRRRRMETHPDHAGGDPAEFERRGRLSRDINRARDIIVNHRYPRTRGATHAWAS